MLTSSGYVSEVDEDLCISCESCASYCQFEALELNQSTMTVIYDKCMGCGVCIDKCDQDALVLVTDENKGVPLVIRELLDSAV